MKNDPIESAIERIDHIPLRTPEGKAALAKALAAKSNLVVAKAARAAGGAQWIEMAEEMVLAFDRMIAKGAAIDKGCAAMTAIARALVQFDSDVPELFLRGMRHVQKEPVWGGTEDTAIELRGVCAIGLANSSYSDKLRELVPLLVDGAWGARVGAIRALAAIGSEPASLLLRFKMLSGDTETEVMSECFAAVLAVEGASGVPLVTKFAGSGDGEVREAAILALGESRRADAVEWLTAEFASVADPSLRKCILLALSTSRTEAAIGFLLDVVRNGSVSSANHAMAALAIHTHDEALRAQTDEASRARGDEAG
jgi:HEAT repeat protein